MGKVAVVIINFQSENSVKNLVSEVSKNENVSRIFLINNSSETPEFKSISQVSSKVSEIQNSTNVGFAAAVNLGIKEALKTDVEKVLLLNPDIIIDQKSLSALCNSPGDIVGPVLKFKRGEKTVFDFGGKIDWILGRATHIEKFENNWNDNNPGQIDYISGACLMIKRDVFEKIGFFDERFFMYFEDVDFCLRAKGSKSIISINPNIIVVHLISEHKVSKDQNKFKYLFKSNFQFDIKWIPRYSKPPAIIYFALQYLLIRFKIIFSY